MLRGLSASLILHAGIIGSGFIVLPHVRPPVQTIEIVPIDIVTVSEVTNVRTIARTEKRVEETVEDQPPEPPIEELLEDLDTLPEETDTVVEEDTPPPPPDKAEEQKPEDIIPEEADEKELEPEEKEPEPEKDEKPRDALDDLLDDNLFEREEQVLLDKTAKQPQRTPPPQPREEPPEETQVKAPQRGVGDRTANEARVEALLWSQMEVCWGTVADLPDPERLGVTVRVKLKRDGTLEGGAELVSPRRAPLGDRFMGQAIDRALRAVTKCQPYNLPGDDYDVWREITMNFRHDR